MTQLRAFMLAHQNCSVSKAMALGQNIPVGLPKLIVKDHSLDTIMVTQTEHVSHTSNSAVGGGQVDSLNVIGTNEQKEPATLYFLVNKST